MKNKRKNAPNYLDFIPRHNEKYPWEIDEQGVVTIFVENKGVFNRIAQKFFNKPEVSQIHLEEMGSFIWPLIDGERSIMAIGESVKEYFGEDAEPLYPRLAQYIKDLESYDFIKVEKMNS
mgnify:CR=1 FL=1